jgi:RND family efflux transporter MFP subunit
VPPASAALNPPGESRQASLAQAIALARRLGWRTAGVLLLAVLAFASWRLLTLQAKSTTTGTAADQALPVPVAAVTRTDLFNELSIPAEFRPYEEVELHAKVSGYVSQIPVDFGDRVKAGQLLAILEVPELKDELNQAKAAQQRAEADYADAHTNYTRLASVVKDHPNLIAQQDLDNAEAKDRSTQAATAEAKAHVERYQTLLAYTRITAPFDGVITHRYVDQGALIQTGTASETQTLPLVRVSDNYRLRLDFPVSVAYVKDVHIGDSVEVKVESLGGRTFTNGIITRATFRVNDATRTMLTEIEVPNPDLELIPGMYAKVLLRVQRRPAALAIPMQAVPPGQTSSVYVVNPQHQIEERPVVLGLDTPSEFEVTSGLKEGELVFLGNRNLVHPGQQVEPKLASALTMP